MRKIELIGTGRSLLRLTERKDKTKFDISLYLSLDVSRNNNNLYSFPIWNEMEIFLIQCLLILDIKFAQSKIDVYFKLRTELQKICMRLLFNMYRVPVKYNRKFLNKSYYFKNWSFHYKKHKKKTKNSPVTFLMSNKGNT